MKEPIFREVKKFGKNGAHISVPNSLIGHTVQILLPEIGDPYLRKSQIKELCEDLIEEAKQPYR